MNTQTDLYIYLFEQQTNSMMPIDTCSSRQQLKFEIEKISKEIIIASFIKYSLYWFNLRVNVAISFTKNLLLKGRSLEWETTLMFKFSFLKTKYQLCPFVCEIYLGTTTKIWDLWKKYSPLFGWRDISQQSVTVAIQAITRQTSEWDDCSSRERSAT